MARRIARMQTLFTVPESPEAAPALLCGHCECGHVFFPAQRLGCERCGAYGDRIEIVETAARGVLRAFARVYRPRPAEGARPQVLGTVVLDAGPAFEVILAASEEDLSVGQRVRGLLVESGHDEQGRILMDCVFAPEASR
jgi:uncharacterized OB-fold protein